MQINLEETRKIAFATAIIGFIALVFFLPEETYTPIEEITAKNTGQKIRVLGTIEQLVLKNNNAFFELKNNATISCAYFNPDTRQMVLLKENQPITAKGTINLYDNKIQLLVEEVGKIDE